MGLLRLFRPHPMPRPKGSAAVLEDRRRRALALVDSGYTLNQAARQIGCSSSSVVYWFHARRRGGEKALHVRFSPGRPRKLTPRQERRLIQLLAQGPLKRGYRTNVWTSKRIAQLIDEEFGICYHPNHIGRLMFRLGWSHQKPKKPRRSAIPRKSNAGNARSGRALKKSRGAGRPRSFRRRVRIHAHSQRG
jgi:transposase